LSTIAKVRGEPFTALPQDLYIPPDALSVYLDTFEGPLDLLLYLIRKHSLDILDIPMAELTRQYLSYVEMMRANQFELAAEYLLMAAVLIDIKSRMLLPRRGPEIAEEADPRAELTRRLIEYEQMKRAAEAIADLPLVGRDFLAAVAYFDRTAKVMLPNVSVAELHAAWLDVLARARINRHHRVTREELSVREHMTRILRRLQAIAPGAHIEFTQLFDPDTGVHGLVVALLAILELCKETLIAVTQTAPFAPIHVRLAEHMETAA
jgi:segregation and condensation protein A